MCELNNCFLEVFMDQVFNVKLNNDTLEFCVVFKQRNIDNDQS